MIFSYHQLSILEPSISLSTLGMKSMKLLAFESILGSTYRLDVMKVQIQLPYVGMPASYEVINAWWLLKFRV